jgi:hypothetical protein
MTSTIQSFAELSNDDLLATVKRLALTECRATAALARSLMELDIRSAVFGRGQSARPDTRLQPPAAGAILSGRD